MKIVICWTGISGYMAACWRALAARTDVELSVIAFRPDGSAPFDEHVMAGLDCHLLDRRQRQDGCLIHDLVVAAKPDAVFIAGWGHKPYNALVHTSALRGCGFSIGMDTARLDTWRQFWGRFWLRRHLERFDAVMVVGERAWQFARYAGAPQRKIWRGYYGIDYAAFAGAYEQRVRERQWPRSFVFAARYVPQKGVGTLIDAYRAYRDRAQQPWPLICCGSGPWADRLQSVEGLEDRGFVQPARLPGVFASAGVFVLSSHFEPWGLVIAEACAAGLPVLCTQACGASVELVRSYYNGLTVPAADAEALSRGMLWMHEHHDALAVMGERSRCYAAAYSAERWADRWQAMFRQITR